MESEPPAGSLPPDYPLFLSGLKERIRAAQVKAVLSVNREMIALYWDLGRQVVERQKRGRWGTGIIEQISRHILAEFPGIKGFSRSNIQRMRVFYVAWAPEFPICAQAVRKLDQAMCPQPVSELPWGHNIVLLEQLQAPQERLWYARQTLQHGWSRPVLVHQIESGPFKPEHRHHPVPVQEQSRGRVRAARLGKTHRSIVLPRDEGFAKRACGRFAGDP
jgi:predicted nuclease of restriction endonuclease-like (RecB) superfamily